MSLFYFIGLNMLFNGFVLILWTAITPPELNTIFTTGGQSTGAASTDSRTLVYLWMNFPSQAYVTVSYQCDLVPPGSSVFAAVMFTWNFAIGIAGVWLAFQTRQLPTEHNDARWVASAIFIVSIDCAIVIPLSFLISDNNTVSFVIQAVALLTAAIPTMLLLCLPVYRTLNNPSNQSADPSRSHMQPSEIRYSSRKKSYGDEEGKSAADVEFAKIVSDESAKHSKQSSEPSSESLSVPIPYDELLLEVKYLRNLVSDLRKRGSVNEETIAHDDDAS
jgi:hypothetical protein